MGYISDAKHKELTRLFEQLVDQDQTNALPDIEFLKRNRHALVEMYEKYHDRVAELFALIKEYQDLYRKSRVQLRRLQLSLKQQHEMNETGRASLANDKK